MAEEESCDCEEGAPAWMATFSDMATLLLTFFVLLLSFAELNVKEFREMLGSIREAFGVQFVTRGPVEAMNTTPVELNDVPASPLVPISDPASKTLREVKEWISEHDLDDDVEVELTERGILVRVRDRVLFDTGSAALESGAEPVLRRIAELARELDTTVAVEGHTDDRPIRTRRFPSNWELSTARAASVVRWFIEEAGLPPGKLRAAGFADTRPVAPNDSDENRSRNRRVEFVFEGAGEPADRGTPRAGGGRLLGPEVLVGGFPGTARTPPSASARKRLEEAIRRHEARKEGKGADDGEAPAEQDDGAEPGEANGADGPAGEASEKEAAAGAPTP